MLSFLATERRTSDLTQVHRWFLIILVSMGSSTIYGPAYLKGVFYDPLINALGTTNEGLGNLSAAYAFTALICYLPSGIVADKVRMRTLAWVGFGLTSLLTFVFAALPSFQTLMLIFVGMGVSTILVWWGIRYKLIRLCSQEDEYSRNIGISYGIYGLAGMLVGFVNLAIIKHFAENSAMGVRALLIFLGVLIGILAILSFLFIPKFEGEIGSSDNAFSLAEVGNALKNPVIWIAAATMFCVYFYYTGITYTTPYLTGVMGASIGVVSTVSLIRTYGITLLSGPAFGFLAKIMGSSSKLIAIGSLMVAGCLVAFMFLPANQAMVYVAAVIIIVLGFIANGVFGIVSSQLTEGRVPMAVFGTATGILSVIGFLPDTFSSKWFGKLLDAKGNDAYADIYLILAGFALASALFALLLVWYVRRMPKVDEASEEEARA